MAAVKSAGPLAKPPVPTAKSGLKFLIVFLAFNKLEINLNGKPMFFNKLPLSNPAIFKPTILKPACGTFSISIFPFAPMNKNSASGNLFLISSAMAIAGKICPPVPPPLIKMRISLFSPKGRKSLLCMFSFVSILFFKVPFGDLGDYAISFISSIFCFLPIPSSSYTWILELTFKMIPNCK